MEVSVATEILSEPSANHTQPAFQESYLDDPMKPISLTPLPSPPFISKLFPYLRQD